MAPRPSDNDGQIFADLRRHVRGWSTRRKQAEALRWIPRGLLAGLLVAVLVATVARLRPWLSNPEVGWISVGLTLTAAAAAGLWVAARPRSLAAEARFADHAFSLQERISTAVEIQSGTLLAPPELARRQLMDALRAAQSVNARARLPLRPAARDWVMIALAGALLALAVWLPNPQAAILSRQRAVADAIAEQEQGLTALAEEVRQNPGLSDVQREAILEPVERALSALDQGDLSQEEAVAVLSEAEAELKSLSGEFDQGPLREALAGAGQALGDSAAGAELGEELAGGDLAGAAAAANELADALPDLPANAQAELAAALAETAAALAPIDPELARQLAEAAAALEAGDVSSAQDALREAAAGLQDRAQQQNAARQAAGAAAQLDAGRSALAGAGDAPLDQGEAAEAGPSGGAEPGAADAGPGNGIESLAPGGDSTAPGGPPSGQPGPGGGHVDEIYVPPELDLGGVPGEDVELPAVCRTDPSRCGPLVNENPTALGPEDSRVPYSQVFGDYRDAAYESLDADYVPLGLKALVRDYFSSLEP